MYDLIPSRRLNKKKVAALIILLILLVILSTVSGIKIAQYNRNKKQAKEYQKQQEKIREEENEREKEEQRIKQAEIQSRIEKTSRPFSAQEIEKISHIYRSNGAKRVFLTFDDGPSKTVTPLILDLLKNENIKATFFTLGNNARYNPELIKREFNEGHYVANHGFSHKYSEVYASPEATLNEYNVTEQAIKDALGNQNYTSRLFRFPGGSNGGYYNEAKQASKALLHENGVMHLDWNALSEDAVGTHTKEELLQNTLNTIGDSDSVVILMHDTSDKILTYEMLYDLIINLKQRNYKFENIYDLLD